MGDKADQTPTPDNWTLLQGFEWNVPADGKHWQRLQGQIDALKAAGVDNIWLPPGCKASSPDGNGYDIYDLWDLGEFEQKGSRRTKWGSKEELVALAEKAKEAGVGLYWDAVLNHKAGADSTRTCMAVEVDAENRNKEVSDPYEIEAWLGFEFPGRGEKYSKMKYDAVHFTGTDLNARNKKKGIYRLVGENKSWSKTVDDEQGNADFLMFADIDYHQRDAVEDVKAWGVWIAKELGLKGFRLDAVQHFSEVFTNEWVGNLREQCGGLFIVGEFWNGDREKLTGWLGKMGREFALYDAPLLYNFSTISTTERADLRKVFDKTLVEVEPTNAVTVVMNHDTQPGQTVETPIEGFFKPLAYSLILLRNAGYPSVFYGDLYGMRGAHPEPPSCGNKLADMVLARKLYAYGAQDDYFDAANCIGWVRRGTWDRPSGLACVMSNTGPGEIRMCVGEMHKGETWTDVLEWEQREVRIDDDGFGVFVCPGDSVGIWVNKEAEGRDRFPVKFDSDIYKD